MRRRGRDFWFAVIVLAPVAALPIALVIDLIVHGDRFDLPMGGLFG